MKEIQKFIERNKKYIESYTSNIKTNEESVKIVDDFRELVKNRIIAIWGAGCVGRDLINLFREMEISVKIVVDKNAVLVNDCVGEKVYSVDEIKRLPADTILIAACNRNIFEEFQKELRELDSNISEMICGNDLHTLLQSAWCMIKACDINQQIDLKNCYECTVLDNTCNSLCQYLKRINGYKEQKTYRTKNVKMIGYLLSNICTLRCKNCCEKVPYMPHDIRHFVDAETVVKDINKMAEACEFLTLLEFIGGEPFLHPELPRILEEVKKIVNIGMIHIFTNGTVIPTDDLCKSLHNQRITVYLSNYQVSYPENMRKNVDMTVQKLTEYHVQFFFGKKTNWSDFSSYELQCADEEMLIKKFPDCFLHNCNRLMEGKLYVCPHQYSGIMMGEISDSNTLNIYDYSAEELASELEKFKKYAYIDACKYCSMPYDAETVLSGEQLV